MHGFSDAWLRTFFLRSLAQQEAVGTEVIVLAANTTQRRLRALLQLLSSVAVRMVGDGVMAGAQCINPFSENGGVCACDE